MAIHWQEEAVRVDGVAWQLQRAGSGPRLVVLHGEEIGRDPLPFHNLLAERFEVVVPYLPGLGRSELPSWVETVDDLAYLSLDLVETLGGGVHLLGTGFGGWVAAEMAVRCDRDLKRLVLADALGIKVSEPWVREIADLFVLSFEEQAQLAWYDPSKAVQMKVPGAPDLSDEDLYESLRHREVVLTLGWCPFMHNPKLRRRLSRVTVPTLVLWGESDRVVTPQYGRAYHEAIQGSEFRLIPQAGHYPHREQPEAFVAAVAGFLRSGEA